MKIEKRKEHVMPTSQRRDKHAKTGTLPYTNLHHVHVSTQEISRKADSNTQTTCGASGWRQGDVRMHTKRETDQGTYSRHGNTAKCTTESSTLHCHTMCASIWTPRFHPSGGHRGNSEVRTLRQERVQHLASFLCPVSCR